MSNSSTVTVPENSDRLRRGARGFLIGAIVMWVLFLLVLLGSVAGAALSSSSGDGSVNAGEILGRVIGILVTVGVPLVLAIVFTVRSITLYKRSAALELRAASSY